MVKTTQHNGNSKAIARAKKIEILESASKPVNKTLELTVIPLITSSTNLTSNYIGNITKNSKGNIHNE